MTLSLLFLGPFTATIAGRALPESRAMKIEGLLAYLAMEANHPHRREKLAGIFFPEVPEDQARTNLRQTIKRLRDILPEDANQPHLLVTRESIQFNMKSEYYLDTVEFTELLAGCSVHRNHRDDRCPDCMTLAGDAIALYRGLFLDGLLISDSVSFDNWLLGNQEHFQHEAIKALEQLANYAERRGNYEQAEAYNRRLIDLDPWREESFQRLIRVLAFQGKRAAALHQFETLKELLWEELAVDPLPETIKLRKLVASSTEVRPHDLPSRDPSFIGRNAELAKIQEYLADPDSRLITLVGSGGSGKTALAIEVGWRVASNYLGPYIHGVFFVPLANIRREETNHLSQLNPLVSAVAQSVGFSFAGSLDPKKQLFNFLRDRPILLILDNVEHLLDHSRSFIRSLLAHCPGTDLLITSRSRSSLSQEWIIEVGGLPYEKIEPQPPKSGGESSDDALKLFIYRARRLRPQFSLDKEDANDLSVACTHTDALRICSLLQGIPLGIELAASWIRLLTCAEIANEIEQNLDFLQSALADIPERQHSLRAVFDYSWNLLEQKDQRVLQSLSVFAGSFDRQAAESVCLATLSQLSTLVDHSLIRMRENQVAGSRRFELLEVIRQYASEKLKDDASTMATQVGSRHSVYYLNFLSTRNQAIRGPEQQATLEAISREMANIRKAWRWAIAHLDVTSISDSLDTLSLFYYMHSLFADGADQMEVAVNGLSESRDNDRGNLLWGRLRMHQGWFNFLSGRQQVGQSQLSEALGILQGYDRAEDLSLALGYLAVITYTLGDYDKACELSSEGLKLSEQIGDPYFVGVATNILSQLNYRMGRYGPARDFGQQSLAQTRKLDSPWGMGFALINLGRVALVTGEFEEAVDCLEEALSIREAIGDARGIALCQLYLGDVAMSQGSWDKAFQLWEQSLERFEEIGNLEGMSAALSRLGRGALREDALRDAQNYFLKALKLADQARAVPRMLDALIGLASLLSEGTDQHTLAVSAEKIVKLANLVTQHPAATQESRSRAADLLADKFGAIADQEIPISSTTDLDKQLAIIASEFLEEVETVGH